MNIYDHLQADEILLTFQEIQLPSGGYAVLSVRGIEEDVDLYTLTVTSSVPLNGFEVYLQLGDDIYVGERVEDTRFVMPEVVIDGSSRRLRLIVK